MTVRVMISNNNKRNANVKKIQLQDFISCSSPPNIEMIAICNGQKWQLVWESDWDLKVT